MRRACGRRGVRSPLWSPLEFCGKVSKRFYRVVGIEEPRSASVAAAWSGSKRRLFTRATMAWVVSVV